MEITTLLLLLILGSSLTEQVIRLNFLLHNDCDQKIGNQPKSATSNSLTHCCFQCALVADCKTAAFHELTGTCVVNPTRAAASQSNTSCITYADVQQGGYGENCSKEEDMCLRTGHVCLHGRCDCELGYRYNSSADKCIPSTGPDFNKQRSAIGTMVSEKITEASGLAASRKHPGYLYTHNDGNYRYATSAVYVISATTAALVATLTTTGVAPHDLEDIAVGPCRPGNVTHTCIYIGDIGEGYGKRNANMIYRFPEPDKIKDQEIEITQSDVLAFNWEANDSGTLLVDPDATVYVISGTLQWNGSRGFIVKIPSSGWDITARVDVVSDFWRNTVNLNIDSKIKAGDISWDGKEILVKTGRYVEYWNTSISRDYVRVLTSEKGTPVSSIYTFADRTQAMCWDAAGDGFYTIEEGLNKTLYYNRRG